MIQIDKNGPVIKLRMARSFFGKGIYFTSAYWIDGLMVDTGCAYTAKDLLSAVENLDLGIRTIVNTHSHEDHVGGNAALQEKFKPEVLAHKLAIPPMADPSIARPLRMYQKVFWGRPKPTSAMEIKDNVKTSGHEFKVIHTPGHSPDSICLHEPREGWIFSGDAYVGGRDRAIRTDYDIWQIIASLKKLAALDLKTLFSGSGSIYENPRPELTRKISYLEELGDKVLRLHDKGWSRKAIRRYLLGREGYMAYFTMGDFSGSNLVRSYIENH